MNKKRFLGAIVIGGIVGILLFLSNLQTKESIAKVVDNYRQLLQQSSHVDKTITLYEAWDISQKYAKIWSKDSVLISLGSVDVDDPDASKAGENGKRRTWQAVFTSLSLDKQLFVQVTNGIIVNALEDGSNDAGLAVIREKPAIDSPEALKQTKKLNSDFGSSVGKGKGYHFILQTNEDGKIVLTVVGSTKSSDGKQKPTKVDIDFKTKEVVKVKDLPK